MGEIIAFNGKLQRRIAQGHPPQLAATAQKTVLAGENGHFAPRVLRQFYDLRMSVERIAARENTTRLRVQRVVRENSVPLGREAA